MRAKVLGFWRSLLVAMFFWGTMSSVHAGLYNPAEPAEGILYADFMKDPQKSFRTVLYQLRSIGFDKVEFDNPLRRRYVTFQQLVKRGVPGDLSLEQKIQLSAVMIRTKKPEDAIQLLMPLSRQAPDHLLLQANLATAYQAAGQDQRARDAFKDLLKRWPKHWDELNPEQQKHFTSIEVFEGTFHFLRQAEELHAKLVDLRFREKLKKVTPTQVDALFADDAGEAIKYVGENGQFEPGRIAALQKKKLPRNSLELIQQLLVWMPEDPRLYWQLGELYNVRGGRDDVVAASAIFDDLWRNYQYQPPELGIRRTKMLEAMARLSDAEQQQLDLQQKLDAETKKTPTPPSTFDWRTWWVAMASGFFVGVFTVWQFQEFRRRHRRN